MNLLFSDLRRPSSSRSLMRSLNSISSLKRFFIDSNVIPPVEESIARIMVKVGHLAWKRGYDAIYAAESVKCHKNPNITVNTG